MGMFLTVIGAMIAVGSMLFFALLFSETDARAKIGFVTAMLIGSIMFYTGYFYKPEKLGTLWSEEKVSSISGVTLPHEMLLIKKLDVYNSWNMRHSEVFDMVRIEEIKK